MKDIALTPPVFGRTNSQALLSLFDVTHYATSSTGRRHLPRDVACKSCLSPKKPLSLGLASIVYCTCAMPNKIGGCSEFDDNLGYVGRNPAVVLDRTVAF